MKLINKHNRLELIIEDGLLDRLEKLGVKYYPNEFGGFLIGYYANDFKTVFVTDFLLPKKHKSSSISFERSIEGLEKKFKKIFDQDKHYFIGEWHTHPDGSSKHSQTDLEALIKTVECETVKIKNPILLIISINKSQMIDYSFYFYDEKKLIIYE